MDIAKAAARYSILTGNITNIFLSKGFYFWGALFTFERVRVLYCFDQGFIWGL